MSANVGRTKVVVLVERSPATSERDIEAKGEDALSRELAVVCVRRKNGERALRVDEEHGAAHAQDIVATSQVAGKCVSSRCLIERLRRTLPCAQRHAAHSRAIAAGR